MTEQKPNSHHLFGPSSMDRRYSCPMSLYEEKGKPEMSSEDARLGDAYHAEMHRILTKITDTEGHIWPFDPSWFDDLSDLAAIMLDRVMSIVAGTTDWQQVKISPNVRLFSELRLELNDPVTPYLLAKAGEEMMFGTTDVVVVEDDYVCIIDFKTGHNEPVKADDTLQTAEYALMACQKFGKEQAWVHIINPNFKQEDGYFFTSDALKNVYAMTKQTIERCADCLVHPSNDKYHPTEENCRYCKGNLCGTCKAVHQLVESIAESPAAVPAKKDAEPPLAILSDEDLCILKEKCNIVAKAVKAVDAELKRRCNENGSCGGYYLKKTNGPRKITDLQQAFNLATRYIAANDFLNFCTVSVPSLKSAWADAMKKSGDVKTKKEAEDVFDTVFDPVIGYGEDSTVLSKAKGSPAE